MHLPQADIELFFKIWFSLLTYANKVYPIIPEVDTSEDLRGLSVTVLKPVRDMLYQHPDMFDSYVAENPDRFSEDELAIVHEWRFFIHGDFILLRQLKSRAIFLDPNEPPTAYGVLSLVSSFEEMIDLPAMIEATLLPFKGQIIYDGFFGYRPVSFGRGILESFHDAYLRAKSMHGLITSLPFTPREEQNVDEEMLRFYVKSAGNREQYCDEIDDLLRKNPALLPLYHQEIGKHNVRILKQRLREQGVAPAWFAVLDGMLLTCGKTRDEVVQNIAWLLPREKRDYVHIFQWKS